MYVYTVHGDYLVFVVSFVVFVSPTRNEVVTSAMNHN
jgi:hypothetical protein